MEGCCTSRCCARRTRTRAFSASTAKAPPRCRAWSPCSPGRTFRAGFTAPPARRSSGRSRRHLHARQRGAFRRPARRRGGRRNRSRRGGGLPADGSDLRAAARRVRSRGRHGAGRAAPARQGRSAAQAMSMSTSTARSAASRTASRGRCRARGDLFHLTRAACPSRDPWLDRLARRRRARPRSHQFAGSVHRAEQARPSVRPARPHLHVFTERVGGGFGGKQE